LKHRRRGRKRKCSRERITNDKENVRQGTAGKKCHRGWGSGGGRGRENEETGEPIKGALLKTGRMFNPKNGAESL